MNRICRCTDRVIHVRDGVIQSTNLSPTPKNKHSMMEKRYDLFATALLSLRRNFMRSILTTLGIIGISAVIIMFSLGEGAQREVVSRSKPGTNLLWYDQRRCRPVVHDRLWVALVV